jgi:Protein of unknown function (DUF2934)
MARKPASKAKSSRKTAAVGAVHSPPNERVSLPDEDRIRERAYDIWIEEGRPHGRDLAHWQRARRELQGEAKPR